METLTISKPVSAVLCCFLICFRKVRRFGCLRHIAFLCVPLLLHDTIGFHPAIVRAVFDIHSRGREYLPAIRAGAITPPAFRRLADVKFSPTVRMTEFGVRNARHEGFPTLFTDSFKRWTQVFSRSFVKMFTLKTVLPMRRVRVVLVLFVIVPHFHCL